MVERLADDHANARRLAEGLAEMPGFDVDLDRVHTNIVYFEVADGRDAAQVAAAAQSEGVLVLPTGPRRLRAVTHYGIEAKDIDMALDAFRRVATAS